MAGFCKKYRWPLTGALLGALVFLAVYGVRVLDPTSVDWLLNNVSEDPAQHYLGWVFFRRSATRLPYIGASYSVIYPFRTSVLFSDSLPLLALLFKALDPILPEKFQYFGWWGLACYALQGGLGQAVIARLAGLRPGQTAKYWGSVAGAGILVLFPALTMRMFAHTALAANWLVLLALYLFLRSDELSTCRVCLTWGGLGLLCAGIHLYYLPMTGIVLVGFAVSTLLQKRGAVRALGPIAAFCAAALAELVLMGAFASNFAGYANGYLKGADLADLFVPGLYANWEQNVYMGLGAVLAVVLALAGQLWRLIRGRVRPASAEASDGSDASHESVSARRARAVAFAVMLVLDAVAGCGNTLTLAGHTLFTVDIPQPLMNFWSMFSSCARLLWLAGMLLIVLGCAGILRVWGGRTAAALLAACLLAQGYSMWGELAQRYANFHDDARYSDQTVLTDPAWEQLADSGRFQHMAFVTFDFQAENFWDLAAFAADHGWTSNSFYLGHMDGNLAAVTLPGELADLTDDTLYVFLEEDELARGVYALHYYRLNGVLVGSTQPLDDLGLTEEPAPETPSHAADLTQSAVLNGEIDETGVTLTTGGELSTEDWTLFPGQYRVTLTGSGFDHSYIYDSYGLANQEHFQHELNFTGIAPERMVFEFTADEMLYYWHTNVHTLDDVPITVDAMTIEKIG